MREDPLEPRLALCGEPELVLQASAKIRFLRDVPGGTLLDV
jgi:hypothetical protein